MKRPLRPALLSLTLAFLTACSAPGTTPITATPTLPAPTTPDPSTPVQVTDEQGLTMSVQNYTVNLVTGDLLRVSWLPNTTWSSDNSRVVSVQRATDGTFAMRAAGTGSTTLRGVYAPQPSVKLDLTINVKAGLVTALALTPSNAVLPTGTGLTLVAKLTGRGSFNPGVTFTSSNPGVASVSSAGRVTALSEGTVTIRAASVQDPSKVATSTVMVKAPTSTSTVTGVSVSPGSVSLTSGQTQPLTATVSGTGSFSQGVSWKSSNPAVASVSASGVVSALGAGTASLTATSTQDSTRVGSATVTVRAATAPSSISAVTVSPSSATLSVGSGQKLTASVSGSGTYNPAVTWTSSNPAVATVSSAGQVTALAAGSVAITATSVQDATKSGRASLSVQAPAPTTPTTPTTPGSDPFNITIVFPANDGLSATQRQAFQQAAQRWQQIIASGLPDTAGVPVGGQTLTVDDLAIEASGVTIDGTGNILGKAGPRYLRSSGLPLTGVMQFDSADLASMEQNGLLQGVIMHEMGHVLGLGTLWNASVQFGGGTSCDAATQVKYLGALGLGAYRSLGGQVAWVPVEDQYGAGTKCGHWKESVFKTELMTGFANLGSMPLSRLTVGALADLGYSVNAAAADPYTIPSLSAQGLPEGQEIHEEILAPLPTPFPGAK